MTDNTKEDITDDTKEDKLDTNDYIQSMTYCKCGNPRRPEDRKFKKDESLTDYVKRVYGCKDENITTFTTIYKRHTNFISEKIKY